MELAAINTRNVHRSNFLLGHPYGTDLVYDEMMVTGTGEKGEALTSGGRVLCVTALGSTVKEAQKHAYDVVAKIHFDGAQYRKDIGYRAIKS